MGCIRDPGKDPFRVPRDTCSHLGWMPLGGKLCLQERGQAGWTAAFESRLNGVNWESPPRVSLGSSPRVTASPVADLGPASLGPLSDSVAASARQKQNPCIMNKFHVQHFKCLFMSPDN